MKVLRRVLKYVTLIGLVVSGLAIGVSCSSTNRNLVFVGHSEGSEPDAIANSPSSNKAVTETSDIRLWGLDLPSHSTTPLPTDIVARSTRAYLGFDVRQQKWLNLEEVANRLGTANLVCFGEDPDSPVHRALGISLFEHLTQHGLMTGREVAVGLEALDSHAVVPLEHWQRGQLSHLGLLTQSEWEKRWGGDKMLTLPLLDAIRSRNATLLALNADHALVEQILRHGLDALSKDESSTLPSLDLDDQEYRQNFEAALRQYQVDSQQIESLYEVEVLRVETMAEQAVSFVQGKLPAQQLLVMAGREHCRKPGIPKRSERRLSLQTVSIIPILATEAGPSATEVQGYDMALVIQPSESD